LCRHSVVRGVPDSGLPGWEVVSVLMVMDPMRKVDCSK
jgi:hypothetical protein